jgi:hypothetical protein
MDSAWRLTNPWVQELRAYWRKNHRADVGRARIVDLDEVNLIEAQLNYGFRLFSFTRRWEADGNNS